MQEENYETLKNKIENYYQNKIYLETTFETETEIALFFQKSMVLEDDELLQTMKLLSSDTINTIFYDTLDPKTNRIRKHILIYQTLEEKNVPIFKFDHYQSNSKQVDYQEITCCTYLDQSNKIKRRIKISTLKTREMKDQKIVLYDARDQHEYNRKQYHLCFDNQELLSIGANHQMYIAGEVGFYHRKESVINSIQKGLLKIKQDLEMILEPDIRIYQMKKKK